MAAVTICSDLGAQKRKFTSFHCFSIFHEATRADAMILVFWMLSFKPTFSLSSFTFFKRWEYQTTLHASWEISMQVKKQQLVPDMEQQTGSKLGKVYVKALYCHPACLTYMQSTSCEMPG